MIIIETCPKCGHDLMDLVIATYPPIPQKKCFSCGWSWEGEREEVIRVPFGGNSLEMASNNSYLNDFLKMGYSEKESTVLADLAVTTDTMYSNTIDITEATNTLMNTLVNPFLKEIFENDACANCSNNPKNGGSGICFCTLGQQAIY